MGVVQRVNERRFVPLQGERCDAQEGDILEVAARDVGLALVHLVRIQQERGNLVDAFGLVAGGQVGGRSCSDSRSISAAANSAGVAKLGWSTSSLGARRRRMELSAAPRPLRERGASLSIGVAASARGARQYAPSVNSIASPNCPAAQLANRPHGSCQRQALGAGSLVAMVAGKVLLGFGTL